jgi:hypothetical protein
MTNTSGVPPEHSVNPTSLSEHSHIKPYGIILAGPARLPRSPEQALRKQFLCIFHEVKSKPQVKDRSLAVYALQIA